MLIGQMLVTFVGTWEDCHAVPGAFETDRLVATRAGYSIAPIDSLHQHLARGVWANSDVILLHILLQKESCAIFSLLARQTWMIIHLNIHSFTLQRAQYDFKQTGH